MAQCRIAIEWLIGFVHQFEDGLTVVLGNLLGRCVFLYLEVILALDEVGDALVLVGYGVGNVDFVLHPIGMWREIRGYGVSTEIPGVGDRAGYTGG